MSLPGQADECHAPLSLSALRQKVLVHGRLLLVSLLLLRRRLLALKLKLLLRVALLPLELVKPRLLVPEASVFQRLMGILLFQQLLLMLSRLLLLKSLFLGRLL